MKRVLITGASGQIGLALYSLLENNPMYKVYRTKTRADLEAGIGALDIKDAISVKNCIELIKPEIIINCAAMTAVDLCESEQELAYQTNALGPKYLAEAAEAIGATLVHLSSDYVFDGEATQPYIEEDKPNPISIYGKSKQAGDEFVQKICTKSFILRTAWVYGAGKNFVKTMLRLADSGNKIRVVADQFGSPTSALEVARVILFLMETKSYGIYHVTCEGITTWHGFAEEIFKMAGKKVDLEAIPSSEYIVPAKRPMYSVLDNKQLREQHGYVMQNWVDALKEYMSN
ncbi:MAG: dTDP-4-dehydrorhamnose reductase [Mobilitalea sp.]